MKCMVAGKNIEIDTDKKPFSKGSEGKLYLKNGILYKIYYEAALNEGFGDKLRNHSYLSSLETKQIDLPDNLIFDDHGNYVGYTTNLLTKKISQFKGTIFLEKDKLMQNLQTLLDDIRYLTDNYVLLNDVSIFNFILNDDTMYLVDPGRYRISNERKEKENIGQFKYLLTLLIYLDLKYYKIDKMRKIQIFRQSLQEELLASSILDYFSQMLGDYNNIKEYCEERIRYIK